MFYTVLEKRANQRMEDKGDNRGLSLGQGVGVAGAGVLGAGVGGAGMVGAAMTNKKFDKWWVGGSKKMQATEAAANKAFKDVSQPLYDLSNAVGGGSADDVSKLKKTHLGVPTEALGPMERVIDAKRNYEAAASGQPKIDAINKRWEAMSEFDDVLSKARKGASGVRDEALNKVNKAMKLRAQGILGAGVLGGGLALGYGAKKLFDGYNARKQQQPPQSDAV
jgi:hypothetical protein